LLRTKQYLSATEAGRFIGRSAGAIRNLVSRRKIPYRKAGGRLLFIRSELEEWVDLSPGMTMEEISKSNEIS